MMNEELRNMLMLAAKAAGIDVVRSRLNDPMCRDFLVKNSRRNESQESGPWNPRDDDGDSFRLAVKLHIQITPGCYNPDEFTAFKAGGGEAHELRTELQDNLAATRLAVLRVAAEIGKAMP